MNLTHSQHKQPALTVGAAVAELLAEVGGAEAGAGVVAGARRVVAGVVGVHGLHVRTGVLL